MVNVRNKNKKQTRYFFEWVYECFSQGFIYRNKVNLKRYILRARYLPLIILSLGVSIATADQKINAFDLYNEKELEDKFENGAMQLIQRSMMEALWENKLFTTNSGQKALEKLTEYSQGDDKAIEPAIKLLELAMQKEDTHAYAMMAQLVQIGAGSLILDLKKIVRVVSKSSRFK